MKMPSLLSVSLLAALSLPAAAQTAPPQDVPFEGTLKIDVDATDLTRRIFKVRTTMPAKPGPMTLLYPQWIPGNHSPAGPIDGLRRVATAIASIYSAVPSKPGNRAAT